MILGTPTINRVVMAMRESEMSMAPPEWQYSCHSYEFASGFFMGTVGAESEEGAIGFATNTAVNPANLDENIKLKDGFVVPHIWYAGTSWMDRTDDDARPHTTSHHPRSIP